MAVESCRLARLIELFGDRLLHGSTTVDLDESTFDGSLIALYFVPLNDTDDARTDDRAVRELYRTANDTEKTLDIVQICYPDDTAADRKRFNESTDGVPWHSVLYEHAEKRVT